MIDCQGSVLFLRDLGRSEEIYFISLGRNDRSNYDREEKIRNERFE